MCDVPTNVVCALSCPAVDDPQNPVWLPDARSEDCARHYLCFRGEPLLFICPSNLYFDIRTNTCTFPSYSTCRVPGISCAFPNSFQENPRDCTTYYQCVEGFPHLRRCGPNEYYSIFLGGCVEGECLPSIETTTSSFTTTLTTPTLTTPSPIPSQTPSTTVDITTSTTDTSTPMCTTPSTESSTSGMSTTVEPTTTTSEPSSPVTETTTGTIPSTFDPPTTTTPGSETTFSPTTPIETTTPIESTDSPTTTTSFETSSVTPSVPLETTTEEMSTSDNTEPTTTTTAPTPPLDTTTEALPTTTEPTTVETTTMPPVVPEVLCQGISFGVLPYPGNCYMYILCLNNMGTVSECQSNEIFNASTSMCVPGNRDTCTFGMRFGKI
ncbi:integumentary mucin A.1-like [Anopheles albimanus]|uniref:integumentary mucin A.1-like n=1 Tax=Anopheles albimanus TaxID=7167 RepID=UPI0016416BA0|nr:integumentary mucin A.1-like [Anopheles albimanus]